jgi:putative PIN family toxin of toxin-antitoxin system
MTLVTSEPVLAETTAVLARPHLVRTGEARRLAARVLDEIRARADFIAIPGDLAVCRDTNDDMVIETALLGGAEVLVSDDNDILRDPSVTDLLSDAGVRVLTVAHFMAELDEPADRVE